MKLFCSNLHFFDVSEEDLRELFVPFGVIQSVRMPINDKGTHRGFAFVEMFDDEAATQAILNLNGTSFKGRRLSVAEARHEDQR